MMTHRSIHLLVKMHTTSVCQCVLDGIALNYQVWRESVNSASIQEIQSSLMKEARHSKTGDNYLLISSSLITMQLSIMFLLSAVERSRSTMFMSTRSPLLRMIPITFCHSYARWSMPCCIHGVSFTSNFRWLAFYTEEHSSWMVKRIQRKLKPVRFQFMLKYIMCLYHLVGCIWALKQLIIVDLEAIL